MSMFLSAEELIELTGYRRGAEQSRWLKQQGYYVEVNARGIPRITHVQVEEKRRLTANPEPQQLHRTEPNVLGFRQMLKSRP